MSVLANCGTVNRDLSGGHGAISVSVYVENTRIWPFVVTLTIAGRLKWDC